MIRRNMMKRRMRRAIARNLMIVFLTVCVVAIAGSAKATWTNNPSTYQIAQAMAAVDGAIARATLNNLLQGNQNPRTQPEVYRTTVEGNYALASWRWGEGGGQAVLAKRSGQWQVLISGGGAVDAPTLVEAGVPSNIAQILIERDQAGWNRPRQ